MSWDVVALNDDGRVRVVRSGMSYETADRLSGERRDRSTETEIAEGWNYVPRRSVEARSKPPKVKPTMAQHGTKADEALRRAHAIEQWMRGHKTQRQKLLGQQISQRGAVSAVTAVHSTMTDSRRRKREAPPLHQATRSGPSSSHAVSSRISPLTGRLGGEQGGYGSESSGCLDRPVSEPSRRG